jgi:hypothetical protein
MQFRETLPIRGCFAMRVFRRGTLIEEYRDHNLIVTGAQNAAARLLAGEGMGKHFQKSPSVPAETSPPPMIRKLSARSSRRYRRFPIRQRGR